MKILFLLFTLVSTYYVIGYTILKRTDYTNVYAYYLSPPLKYGDIRIDRIPMFFGEDIAMSVMVSRASELNILVQKGEIDYVTLLSLHDANIDNSESRQIRTKAKKISLLMKKQGISLNGNSCAMTNQKANAKSLLIDWGTFDKVNEEFLITYFHDEIDEKCSIW